MRLFCLSNGHGEDAIAVRILHALQQAGCSQIEALPIVGEGHAYTKLGIPTIGTVKAMPSGGFIYMDSRQLARDIQGGLVQLTWAQIQAVQTWAKEDGFILAVGDIVPLLFAWLSGAPYGFVATAKSEYYLRDEKGWLPRKSWWDDRLERSTNCIFQPWERWLMRRPQCKVVFPRDRLTADSLQRFNIPAFDLGNPMMDGLTWQTDGLDSLEFTIALIPGSRPPEVYANWEIILQSLGELLEHFRKPLQFVAAVAPGIDAERLHQILISYRWQQCETNHYKTGFGEKRAMLELTPPHRFAECLQRSQVAIAMAGTATEQFVGLGKPAIIIPGNGPQFTPAFAEAQTRLLGASVTLVEQPHQVAGALRSLLSDPDRLQTIAENGRRRMGEPGAAQRIAACLLKQLRC